MELVKKAMNVGQIRRLTNISSTYMRVLPSPPAISIASGEGDRLFMEAKAGGTAAGCLNLLSVFKTQSELTYCGLASLTSVFNALKLDPKREWKGPWRWYDENMLVDAQTVLERIEVEGITFKELVDVACRNEVDVQAYDASQSSLQLFREQIIKATSAQISYIIASYSRRHLKQSGNGHFSPLGAYHAPRDLVLILDVACYKYPPHWIPCSMLWDAMTAVDGMTGKTRGFMVITKNS